MTTNYVYRQIKRISLINLTIPVVLAVIVTIMYINIPFRDILYPHSMSGSATAEKLFSEDVRFVNATFEKLYYTGYDYIKRGKTAGYYYYSLDDNKCTFVLVDSANVKNPGDILTDYTMYASLEKQNTLTRKMISAFSKDLEWTNDGLLSVTSVCFIDETGFNLSMYIFFGVCLFILVVMLFSYLLINLIYLLIPRFAPSCLKFKKITGGFEGLSDVNCEIRNPDMRVFSAKKLIITKNYIIMNGFFSIEIIPVCYVLKMKKTPCTFFRGRCNLTFTFPHKIKTHVPYVRNSNCAAAEDFLKNNL